jgi:hypothetical protein
MRNKPFNISGRKKREGQKLIVVLSAPKHFLEQTP